MCQENLQNTHSTSFLSESETMNTLTTLFIVVSFLVGRPGTLDVPEDRESSNMSLVNDSIDTDISVEEKMKELRIEMVKFQILSKLNVKEVSPSTQSPLETSRDTIKLLLKEEEERQQKRRRLFESEEQLVIHAKSNATSCKQSNISFCKMFRYELSPSLNTSSVDIWIYKLTEYPRWITISLSLSNSNKEKNYNILYYEVYQIGWKKLQLPRIFLPVSWNDTIFYSVEITGQNVEDHGDRRPFLIVSKLSFMSPRQRRDANCDISEKCCLKPLRISFAEIGFNFIVQPEVLDANMCIGNCNMDYSSLSTHYHRAMTAVLERHTTLRASLGECATMCCKPKELESAQIIYNDTNGITHIQLIPEMKVKSCRCT